jgi:hypothetical protein
LVHAVIYLPNGLFFGPLSVEVDGKPQTVTPFEGLGYTTLALNLSQGPHQVAVKLATPPTTVTTTTLPGTTATSVVTTTLPATTVTTTATATLVSPAVTQTWTLTSTSFLTTTYTHEINAQVGLTPYLFVTGAAVLAGGLIGYGLLRRRRG